MTRAIVFDLDDTLYRERRFILSGFAAVAREVERRFDVPAAAAWDLLKTSLRQGRRRIAFQELCGAFDLPLDSVGHLTAVVREHQPNLRLPRMSADVLSAMRRDWRVGILTNGLPDTQARKVAALGLSDHADAVVYAAAVSPGKPDAAAFACVLERLGVPAGESVFVGDDPFCDMFGARRAGMRTIQVCRGGSRPAVVSASDADAVVACLSLVPQVAGSLIRETRSHVA